MRRERTAMKKLIFNRAPLYALAPSGETKDDAQHNLSFAISRLTSYIYRLTFHVYRLTQVSVEYDQAF
jgi:hypothetical protein